MRSEQEIRDRIDKISARVNQPGYALRGQQHREDLAEIDKLLLEYRERVTTNDLVFAPEQKAQTTGTGEEYHAE